MTIRERLARAKAGEAVSRPSALPSAAPTNRSSLSPTTNVYERLNIAKKAENTTPDKPPSVLERIGLAVKSGASEGIAGTVGALQKAIQWSYEKVLPEEFYNKVFSSIEANEQAREEATAKLREQYPNAILPKKPAKIVNPQEISRQSQADLARATEGASGVGKFALEGLSSIANMGTGAVTSAVTGMPFIAAMGLQAGGSAALSAEAKGKTLDQQLLYGGLTGLATGAIEALGGIGASKALSPVKAKVFSSVLSKLPTGIRKWATSTGGQIFSRILSSGLSEAAEEGIEYNTDRWLQKLIIDEEVPFDIKEMAYQSLLGGTVGTLFGGVNVGAEALRSNVQQATAEQTSNTPPTQPQSTQNDATAQTDIPMPQEQLSQQRATESVIEDTNIPGARIGRAGETYTAHNEPVRFRYAIVPADSLVTSHDRYGYTNKAYPVEMQPRDRTRVSSMLQVNKMSKELNPRRLAESAEAQNGAPIVRNDGVVISGNGRVLAIKAAYEDGFGANYETFLRENAAKYGIEGDLPPSPILIRIADNVDSFEKLAQTLNETATATYSATEYSMADANKMANILDLFVPNDDGIINTSDNADFIRAFVDQVIPEAERGGAITKTGKLSQTGLIRARNAIFAAAYGDPELSAKLSEYTDDNTKNITNALLNTAPNALHIKRGIESGSLYNINIIEDVIQAARLYEYAKSTGSSISEIINQTSMLEQYSPETQAIALFMEANKRSAKQIRLFLNSIYDAIYELGDPNQISLLGGEADGATKQDIINAATLDYLQNTEVENPNIGFSLDEYNMAAESRAAGGETTASEGAGETVVATNGNEATAGEVEWQDLFLGTRSKPTVTQTEETAQPEAPKGEFIDDSPPESVGAMKSKFPHEQKVSEFYTNTLQETDVISDEARAQLEEKDFGFVSVSEKESVEMAQQRLQVDFDGEVEHLSQADTYVAAEDVDTAMGILASYSTEASETGDWSKVKDWAKNMYEKVHQSAVTLQALDKYSRTPEGAVLKAQQEVSKAERSLTTTEVNGKRVKNKRGRDIDKATKDVIDAIEQEAQAAAEVAAQDAIKQLTKEKGNVPVELWGVAIGDALADRLVSNATKETGTAQPITQTILNDLVKFADEHALPKAKRTTTKRTALDRIRDYYANKSIYTEAWKQAQQQVREMLSDNPEVLDAFDEWVNSTISYNADPMHIDSNMLRAILQASDDIGISKNTIKEMAAFGAIDTVSDRIADHFVQQLGVTGGDAIEVRDAVKRHVTEIAREDNAAQRASGVVKSAINELQINISELLTQNRSNKEAAAKAIVDYLINRFRVTGAEAESVAKTATETFFDELRRRTERRLNAILKPHTSKAKKSLLTRITELYNMGAFDNDSIAELVKEKYGIPTLSADDVRNIYEYAQLANETTDDYQKRVYLYKAGEIIASKKPSTFRDKVLMVRRLAMLLNPKTVISRNAGGNVIFGAVETIKDAPGTAIDYLVSLKTGKRSTSLNLYETAKSQAKGAKKAVTEMVKDVKLGVDTSPTRHELPSGNVLSSKLGRGAEDLLNVLMQFGDRPFFEATYEARMNELQRLGYDTNSEDVQSHAFNYALERVFQNNSVLSEKAAKIRKSLGLLGDITMPFVQTPANIFDKLLDYSPYGFVRSIKLAGTVSDSVWSQKQFVDTLARAFTGTGVLLFGYFGFLKGFLTGSKRDENEKVIGAEQRAGRQEYSIVVDGKSYTYDWASPIGALLAMGANMAQAGVNQEGIVEMLTATTKAGIDIMFQQSYLQGLSELFGKENFSEGLQGVLMGLPASFIPTGFQQIARIIDDTQRDTFDKDPVMRMLKRMAVKIPFASKMLPPKIDPTGEEAKQFQGRSTASNVFESFISPGYIGENVQNAVDKELYDLYSRTGDTDVLPKWSLYTSKSDLKFSVGGQEYEMTDKEWIQYQKTLGKATYSEADKLIKSPDWRKASDADKSEMIKDIISEATERAKREIVEARGDMFLNKAGRERVQEYIKAGLNDKQAYELYNKIQALEPKDGKKTVSLEQKLDVILSSNYSAKTKAGLVATLYDNSLLHKLDCHSILLNIYKSTKDTSYINMTVPDKFSENKTEYVLTDSEKALYEKTFVEFMNKHGKPAPIGSMQAEQARMKKLIGLAKDRARLEVVKSRRK